MDKRRHSSWVNNFLSCPETHPINILNKWKIKSPCTERRTIMSLPLVISEQMKTHPLLCRIPHFYRPLEQHNALLQIPINQSIQDMKVRTNHNRIKMKTVIDITDGNFGKLFDKFKLTTKLSTSWQTVFSSHCVDSILFFFIFPCRICNILHITSLMK